MALTVKLPAKKQKREYSLYVNSEISYIHKDKELGTLICCKGSGVAFYSASNSRRAFIFSELSKKDCKIPLQEGKLPYFKEPVRILYRARGRRIDLLKFMCHNLESRYGKKIYRLSTAYWLTLGSYVDSLNGSKTGSKKRILYLITDKYFKIMNRSGEKK